MKFILIFLTSIVSVNIGNCQKAANESDTIRIQNGSFEVPSFAESHWIVLGDQRYSAPDIHTPKEVIQNVKRQAQHGENFVSMVVRSSDSFEQLGQFLESPLKAGQKYTLSFQAMQAPEFLAMSSSKKLDSHSKAIHIRIYGLNIEQLIDQEINYMNKENVEFLFESELIDSNEWTEVKANIKPSRTTNFIVFAVFWETPVLFPYNGHLLLDNISNIVKVE